MQEAWVQSLGQEDPLEKEMATHSSTLAWEVPKTEEPGGLQSTGSQWSDTTYRLNSNIHLPLCTVWVPLKYFSHEIKRRLLLGRKVMTNLGSILKSRDITLPTKVHLVKAMVFPVVTYGCESWTVKKAECREIDAFKLRC